MTTTPTPDVRKLEIGDQLRQLEASALWFENRLEHLERELAGLTERNGEAMTAENAHVPELLKAFAEQVDSGDTPSMSPDVRWREFHRTASAILDKHADLTKATSQSTLALNAAQAELGRIRNNVLPSLNGQQHALREELARTEREQQQAVAAYKARAKETQSTLTLIKQRLGIP